ncbi:hypothetical protein V6N13_067327 [Hibiscus sabdariffa]
MLGGGGSPAKRIWGWFWVRKREQIVDLEAHANCNPHYPPLSNKQGCCFVLAAKFSISLKGFQILLRVIFYFLQGSVFAELNSLCSLFYWNVSRRTIRYNFTTTSVHAVDVTFSWFRVSIPMARGAQIRGKGLVSDPSSRHMCEPCRCR